MKNGLFINNFEPRQQICQRTWLLEIRQSFRYLIQGIPFCRKPPLHVTTDRRTKHLLNSYDVNAQ